jgi:hypothetical protein
VDGTGWLPVDFTSIPGGSPIPVLPTDPTNTSSYYYSYLSGGSYELLSLLESERYLKSSAMKDKGVDPGRMEMGTDLSLWEIPNGLVGYWPFDGTGAIANNQTQGLEDSSLYHNNGTASNLNATGMTFVAGKVGNAVQFDGVDDWVDAGNDSSLNISGPITLSVWFNTSDPGGTSRILAKQYSATEETTVNACYQLGIYMNKYRLSLYTDLGAADRQVETTQSNVWSHLLGTWNGSQYQIYVNGAQAASGNLAGVLKTNPANPLSIGTTYANEAMYFFTGILDEARIYSRAFSAAEAEALYKAGK